MRRATLIHSGFWVPRSGSVIRSFDLQLVGEAAGEILCFGSLSYYRLNHQSLVPSLARLPTLHGKFLRAFAS